MAKPPAPSAPPLPASDLALRLPDGGATGNPAVGALTPTLRPLLAAAESSQTAANWRQLADHAAAAHCYATAADAYRREAAIYRRTGDGNAAQVEELKGAQYATDLQLYVHRHARLYDYDRDYTHQRLEPRLGCYVGAFIDRDDSLPHHTMDSQTYGDIKTFADRVGKPHASYFMYRKYGQPFPTEWAEYVKSQDAIPHIAWEPASLDEVRNDDYLRSWVAAARALDWPIFLRFAGEMNGDWTPYHGNPAAYRAAFRRVHDAFRTAPKAALIWCPNTVPENHLDDYYPGDDAVDWVGVNFYSVLYLDNDRSRPGARIHPTDLLDYVYRRYSARKPIAIAEYAATHMAQVEGRLQPDFAIDKIAQLYYSLPTRYPRVKLIDWYDCDNTRHARPGRQLNNYLLTDVPDILAAYSRAVKLPWFLGAPDVEKHDDAHRIAVALHDHDRLAGVTAVQAFVRTYLPRPRVFFMLDGRLVYATQRPDRLVYPLENLHPGKHTVEVRVYDDDNRFIATQKRSFEIPPTVR